VARPERTLDAHLSGGRDEQQQPDGARSRPEVAEERLESRVDRPKHDVSLTDDGSGRPR
jgi:hypothetical protein